MRVCVELRHIRGWIQMAEHDALGRRKSNAEREPVSEANVAQFDPQSPELPYLPEVVLVHRDESETSQ